MAIYIVKTPEVEGVVHVIHAPAMGAAKAARRGFMEGFGLKLDQISIEEAEIRTGKAGTIAYLNAFCAQAPASYVPAGYPKAEAAPAKKKAVKKPAKKAAKKTAKKK